MGPSDRIADAKGVGAAADAVARIVPPTPLLPLDVDGQTLWCKAELLQPVGSFKLRGAWWRLVSLSPRERAAGVVAFSSGNHAQGVAWAARRLGIAATIVMPSDAPAPKTAATRALGATIIAYDRQREDRVAIAARIAARSGAVLVPSFDDPWIIEGQGSVGIEAAAQLAAMRPGAAFGTVVACCGGGGLSAGLALALPGARIITAEPEGWDDMARSLAAGHILPVGADAPPTACDALQTTRVAERTFSILRAVGARGVAVSETDIALAMRLAAERLRLIVEPGGAAALAAILSGKVACEGPTLVTLSGGNIALDRHASMIAAA